MCFSPHLLAARIRVAAPALDETNVIPNEDQYADHLPVSQFRQVNNLVFLPFRAEKELAIGN
jgi:hypothetical protein